MGRAGTSKCSAEQHCQDICCAAGWVPFGGPAVVRQADPEPSRRLPAAPQCAGDDKCDAAVYSPVCATDGRVIPSTCQAEVREGRGPGLLHQAFACTKLLHGPRLAPLTSLSTACKIAVCCTGNCIQALQTLGQAECGLTAPRRPC